MTTGKDITYITASGIPYRVAPRAVLIAEKERQLREYEQIYELSSEKMADLVDRDAIVPSIEVIKWYHIYDGLQFLLETTPHGWNSWDNYQIVHDRRLAEHPFVVRFRDTLAFEQSELEGVLHLRGFVQCQKAVVLEVTHRFETDYDNVGRMYLRCYRFRYIGLLPSRRLLLKYHNLHRNPDEYVHRVYDPATGRQSGYEPLQRYQFPTFPEVLDELEYLAQAL